MNVRLLRRRVKRNFPQAGSYTGRVLRYAITPEIDGNWADRLLADWPGLAERWASQGVDFIQLRAKALSARPLSEVGRAMLERMAGSRTRLLVNGRADVAAAIGAAGVHLTASAEELTPEQVRRVFEQAKRAQPIVSVSCHSLMDVARASEGGADFILFGPVFGKVVAGEVKLPGIGIERLHEACCAAGNVPVLALGGVTTTNTAACVAAGARGIAGIRLFA